MCKIFLLWLSVVLCSVNLWDYAESLSSQETGKGRRKLVLDLDVGCDDAVALLTSVASGVFDVVGITTVYGNADIDHTTANAIALLREIESNAFHDGADSEQACTGDIPVYKGASLPWSGIRFPPRTKVHGENGLGDVDLPDTDPPPICRSRAHEIARQISAAEFLIDICRCFPGEVYLLFGGPLTNLADAIRLYPALPSKWAGVSIMGGTFFPKEGRPRSDANFRADPEAAQYVFNHVRDIMVVGMDVTLNCPFTEADLRRIHDANKNGKILGDIFAHYLRYYAQAHPELRGAPPHDAIALMALLMPELYTWRTASIVVECSGKDRGRGYLILATPTQYIAVHGNNTSIISAILDIIQHPRPPLGHKST